MFPLFELANLVTFRRNDDDNIADKVTVIASCWKEHGEKNFLALFVSNEYLVLRHAKKDKVPVVKELPWFPGYPIKCLCFSPTGSWLLCATEKDVLYILPVESLLNPTVKVQGRWRTDDVTKIQLKRNKGHPTCIEWWHTLEGDDIVLVGTKTGNLLCLDLNKGDINAVVNIGDQICNISIIHDDDNLKTYTLITTKKNGHMKLLLEQKCSTVPVGDDTELKELGFEELNTMSAPPLSILKQTEECSSQYLPDKLVSFQRCVDLSPQAAKGRHFVAAHNTVTGSYKVYDSQMEHDPLFVYRLPDDVDQIILTDKLMFTVGNSKVPHLNVMANQLAEMNSYEAQEFNPSSLTQVFNFPENESITAIYKRSFPYYWVQHKESRAVFPTNEINVNQHTVLDGCVVITSHSIYECRPRVSPERLFIELAKKPGEYSRTERLGVMLGLDVCSLYEDVAKHLLEQGQLSHAVKLFKLAKCSSLKRVSLLLKHNHLPEAINFLQHVLCDSSTELNTPEKKQLADILVHCYIQQILTKRDTTEADKLKKCFLRFLLSDFSYSESTALSLLTQYGMKDFLIEVAKRRGLLPEALDLLLETGDFRLSFSHLLSIIQAGFGIPLLKLKNGIFLHSTPTKDLVRLVQLKPLLALRCLHRFAADLEELDKETLLKLAELFDPSRLSLQTYFGQLEEGKEGSTESSSDLDQETICSKQELASFFMRIVLVLNQKRGNLPLEHFKQTEQGLHLPDIDISLESQSETKQPLQRVTVACGADHSAFISAQVLYTFGANRRGKLGHGDLITDAVLSQPTRVETLYMLQVKVHAVSCGHSHTLALTDHGVYGWGSSHHGQVGVGDRNNHSRPLLLESLADESCVSVVCGMYHSVALTREGRVYTWGWAVHGQLGHGDVENRHVPTRCEYANKLKVRKIEPGYAHTLLLTDNGSIYAMGSGLFGEVGLGQTRKVKIPTKIRGLTEAIVDVSTKTFESLALTESGRVYKWGINPSRLKSDAYSQKKQGDKQSTNYTEPYLLPRLLDVTSVGEVKKVYCGANFLLFLTTSGNVYTVGKNFDGQLGNGNRIEMKQPILVEKIANSEMCYVGVGSEYVIAMETDQNVWGWGSNFNGQLGLKHEKLGVGRTEYLTPVRVDSLSALKVKRRKSSNIYSSLEPDSLGTEDQIERLPNFGAAFDGPRYPAKLVLLMLKYMPIQCNEAATLRQCVRYEAWEMAACLCVQQSLYPEAFHYHLKCVSEGGQLPTDLFYFYVRQIEGEDCTDVERCSHYQEIIQKMMETWSKLNLDFSVFETMLLGRRRLLAYPFLVVYQRLNSKMESDDEDTSATPITRNFSQTFLLQLTQTVVTDIEAGSLSNDLLQFFCPELIEDFERIPNLKSSHRIIPAENLWKGILQNLEKDALTNMCITLLLSEKESLIDQSSAIIESRGPAEPIKAILFTCGHHFIEETFLSTVVSCFEEDLSDNQPSLSSTAALITQYYRRPGLKTMACPNCLLTAINSYSKEC